MGRGAVGIFAADFAGTGLSAGLLGAYRIRVWEGFDSAQANAGDRDGVGGTRDYFPGHAGAGLLAHANEGWGWGLDEAAGEGHLDFCSAISPVFSAHSAI